jgi:hypothetical protein
MPQSRAWLVNGNAQERAGEERRNSYWPFLGRREDSWPSLGEAAVFEGATKAKDMLRKRWG